MTVMVTGGAGYIGSHVVQELLALNIPCVVVDSLVRGHRELVIGADVVVGDVRDAMLVRQIIWDYRVDAVMHFAAYAYVGESAAEPLIYYDNNVAATLSLLRTMVECNVKRMVFSSTCATYGLPETTPIPESHPQRPVNPYGATKLMVERIHVTDLAQAHVLGLGYLERGHRSEAFNLGNGNGFSVLEVIGAVERIIGRPVKSIAAPRRPGDPPTLVGASAKARQVLGWEPKLHSLDVIIETAWAWHSARPGEARP